MLSGPRLRLRARCDRNKPCELGALDISYVPPSLHGRACRCRALLSPAVVACRSPATGRVHSLYSAPRLSLLLPIPLAFLHTIGFRSTHSHWTLSASPRPPCVSSLGDSCAFGFHSVNRVRRPRLHTPSFLFPDIIYAFSRDHSWRITGFAHRARGCGWSHLSYSGQARSEHMLKFKIVLHLHTRICLRLHTGQTGNIVRGSKRCAL